MPSSSHDKGVMKSIYSLYCDPQTNFLLLLGKVFAGQILLTTHGGLGTRILLVTTIMAAVFFLEI